MKLSSTFAFSQNYLLSEPKADLHRLQTAQLVDKKVKGDGPDHHAITSSHPMSSHPHG